MKYLCCLWILFFSISCHNKHANTPSELFDDAVDLTGTVRSINKSDFPVCYDIQISDSVIFTLSDKDFNFNVFNSDTYAFKGSFIKIGRGPKELLNVSSISPYGNDGKVDVYSVSSKKVTTYITKDVLSNNNEPLNQVEINAPLDGFCFDVKRIGNKFVASGMFNDGMLCLFNENGNFIKEFGKYPSFKGCNLISNLQKGELFQGFLRVRPSGDKFVYATSFSELFDIYNASSQGIVKRHSHRVGGYILKSSGPVCKLANVVGYTNITVSQDYIYALYSDKTFKDFLTDQYISKTIFVFDWEGRPILKYNLDKGLKNIAYDKSDNSIIGIGLEDDIVFVKYKLNQ